jgi:hypothetical protein
MILELYEALRAAGVEEGTAKGAARAVWEVRTDLATKADLDELRTSAKADLAELKADLTWRMVLMTGVFVGAVSALKVFG